MIYFIEDCGIPSHIENGLVTTKLTKEALMVDFSCNRGYLLAGNKSVTCQPDGNWTEIFPECG